MSTHCEMALHHAIASPISLYPGLCSALQLFPDNISRQGGDHVVLCLKKKSCSAHALQ